MFNPIETISKFYDLMARAKNPKFQALWKAKAEELKSKLN